MNCYHPHHYTIILYGYMLVLAPMLFMSTTDVFYEASENIIGTKKNSQGIHLYVVV